MTGLSRHLAFPSTSQDMLGALARGISEADKKFALLTQIRINVTMPGYYKKPEDP
jgi:hypothetical protein